MLNTIKNNNKIYYNNNIKITKRSLKKNNSINLAKKIDNIQLKQFNNLKYHKFLQVRKLFQNSEFKTSEKNNGHKMSMLLRQILMNKFKLRV